MMDKFTALMICLIISCFAASMAVAVPRFRAGYLFAAGLGFGVGLTGIFNLLAGVC